MLDPNDNPAESIAGLVLAEHPHHPGAVISLETLHALAGPDRAFEEIAPTGYGSTAFRTGNWFKVLRSIIM
jgi:hypothetical protein